MKRWWLPNQKGTELWPRQTVPPPKLIIEGVQTGTPLYRAVANRFSGRLQQFHAKAQQAYALSPNEVAKLHWQWHDGRAQYINIQGQEILKLEVDHRVFEEALKPEEDHWDFALIELNVPRMYYGEGAIELTCVAHMTSPIEQQLQVGQAYPIEGVAANRFNRSVPDKMLNVAETDSIAHEAAGGVDDTYASFTVDLRPARGLSAVTVDLHAMIRVRAERIPVPMYKTLGTGGGIQSTEVPTGDPMPDENDYNEQMTDDPTGRVYNSRLGAGGRWLASAYTTIDGVTIGWIDYPGTVLSDTKTFEAHVETVFFELLPAITFNIEANEWQFDATGTHFYSEYMGGRVARTEDPGGIYVIDDEFNWWRHWYVHTEANYIPPFGGPDGIPSLVQVTVFKGVPPFDVTRYTTTENSKTYNRWTLRDVSPPGHPGFGVVGHYDVPTYDTNEAANVMNPNAWELFGVPKSGTVTIDLKYGAAFWRQA